MAGSMNSGKGGKGGKAIKGLNDKQLFGGSIKSKAKGMPLTDRVGDVKKINAKYNKGNKGPNLKVDKGLKTSKG